MLNFRSVVNSGLSNEIVEQKVNELFHLLRTEDLRTAYIKFRSNNRRNYLLLIACANYSVGCRDREYNCCSKLNKLFKLIKHKYRYIQKYMNDGRICPECGIIKINKFRAHLKTHGITYLQYTLDYHKLKEVPKCPICGHEVTLFDCYNFGFICQNRSCRTTQRNYTVSKRGTNHMAYNGNPEHDKKVYELHSRITKDSIRNGTNIFAYNGDEAHDILVKKFYHERSKFKNAHYVSGIGFKSTFKINDKFYSLRSKLEFITALYLSFKKYKWRYEKDHTDGWFNDFVVDTGKSKFMFEVKPSNSEVPTAQIESAISHGYRFYIINNDHVYGKFIKYLSAKTDIYKYLNELKYSNTHKEVYFFDFNTL
jgi:hypothetical protein